MWVGGVLTPDTERGIDLSGSGGDANFTKLYEWRQFAFKAVFIAKVKTVVSLNDTLRELVQFVSLRLRNLGSNPVGA